MCSSASGATTPPGRSRCMGLGDSCVASASTPTPKAFIDRVRSTPSPFDDPNARWGQRFHHDPSRGSELLELVRSRLPRYDDQTQMAAVDPERSRTYGTLCAPRRYRL